MSTGSTCAAVGCHNNSKKLKILSETSCVEHRRPRHQCPCPVPYALHSMPPKEERKLAWLTALRLKYPPKRVYVCSFHFVDKKPTKLHPDPELYLGYDRPSPRSKRQKRVRATQMANSSGNVNEDVEDEPRKLNCLQLFPVLLRNLLLH